MQWDLGIQGLALLVAISLGFGVLAGLLISGDVRRRLITAAVTTAACFGAGLVTSEVFFGWATEEELQPNIDGLSRDEVVVSSLLTTALVLLAMRYVGRRAGGQEPRADRRRIARRHAQHGGHHRQA